MIVLGIGDAIRSAFRKSPAVVADGGSPIPVFTPSLSVEMVSGMSADELWRTQPYLRTVVTFLARNVAQLGLHTFRRQSDTDRVRLRDHSVARLLAFPNSATTSYELIYGLVADLALYDRAYWLIGKADTPSGWTLTRIPPAWVVSTRGGFLEPDVYVVQRPNGLRQVDVPAREVLGFHGWHPSSLLDGATPVEALKQILIEQIEAQKYREQVWRRGGRVAAVLSRPAGAPQWSNEARDRFRADWQAKWAGDGYQAGGTPILEDGMTLNKVGFSAHEDEYIDAAKLALTVVASVFHINPTMIGLLDAANYSNVREFRRMLYGDTLGPLLAQIESRLNTFLVPRLPDPGGVYVEFNIAEKLEGNFEEQAAALSSSVGRPWMTADEARAKLNMPSLGGDAAQLVTPLNVLVGGQSSPRDSAPKGRRPETKARPAGFEGDYVDTVNAFFRRQATVVKSRLGAKAAGDWWDKQRWDAELSDDLYALAVKVAGQVGADTVQQIGFSPEAYNPEVTLAWLRDVSERSAASINETTKTQIDTALATDDPDAVGKVFDNAVSQRSFAIAASALTLISGFATVEAAKQSAPGKAWKRWVTGPNPRDSHAAMNGQAVPVSENFSNGAAWPGDASALGADDLAGCNCSIRVYIP